MSFVKRIEKKIVSYQKLFVFFKPEGIILSKDQTGKNQIEIIVYKTIRCLNFFTADSFYFKTNKSSYAFFLRNFNQNDALKWFDNLIILVDKDIEGKSEVKTVDLTGSFEPIYLDVECSNFEYYFGKSIKIIKECRKNSGNGSELLQI